MISGFVSSATLWADFSNAWQAALDMEPTLEYFKMSEANGLVGQFSRDRGWTEILRDVRVAKLVQIIKDHAIIRLHASIKRADYEENISSIAVPQRELIHDKPYTYLFIKLIIAMAIRGPAIGIIEFAATTQERRLNRKRGRKAAKKKASSEEGQPS
jgi:hypothetical protein